MRSLFKRLGTPGAVTLVLVLGVVGGQLVGHAPAGEGNWRSASSIATTPGWTIVAGEGNW
jgi:hypothetical protein